MRQRAQEFVLHPIGILCFTIQLNPVERETQATRHVLHDQRARAGELRRILRNQGEHRVDAAVDHERQHRRAAGSQSPDDGGDGGTRQSRRKIF